MRHLTLSAMIVSGLLVTAPGLAQDADDTVNAEEIQAQPVEPTTPPAPPAGCGYDEAFSDFDFWLGGWNVYARNGAFGGQNFIDKRSGDCLILEQWMSAGGGDGSSMNFLDPRTSQWRQLWVGTNNLIDYSGGLNEAGQMILEGQITYFNQQGSRQADFRGIWTPLDNGHVIQHFQQYDADNDVWNDWFIGTYVPISVDPNGESPGTDATGPTIVEPPAFEISN